jgi:hypothetical protein
MSVTNLPISRLVNFGVVITPAGVQAPSLNTGLVLGTSAVIDVVTRMRTYATLAGVAADFGTSAQEYLAAAAWFGQSPQPTSLCIGRWAQTASAGQLYGGVLSAANTLLGTWTAITNGSLKIAVDGGAATNVTALTFAAATSLSGVAAVIQTAVRALGGSFVAVACVYDPVYDRFIITSGTTGSTSAVAFLTAEGSGTDITGMLEMLAADTLDGAYIANGIAAESLLSAIVIFDNQFGGQWYNEFAPSAADADCEAIGPYFDADATPHFQWYTSQEAAMLAPNATATIGYVMQQLATEHTAIQYSSQSINAAWSMAARIATVNWAGSNTAISLFYKTEPGIAPENLTDTQIGYLESYNVNVFVSYASGTPIIEPGITPSGQFIDTIVGADGLRTQIEANVFSILLAQQAKVPQTDAGVTTIETGVQSACQQYVTNGFGAPGTWNAGGFGTLIEGAYLDTGFYIYGEPIATQSEAQRAARICPPIQVAFKLAGAIDTVAGTIFVNQ